MIKTVEWTDEGVRMIDQRLLPNEEKYLMLRSYEEVAEAIDAGISVVHINTELRIAYKKGVKKGIMSSDELAPYKFMAEGVEEMKKIVTAKLKVFNKIS